MTLRIPRQLRASCAAFALAAYALPMVVGLAAQVGHGAEHALAWIQGMQLRAATMGVAHLHEVRADQPRAAFVHAHGGAPHAHDSGVGALLIAADESDEHAGQAETAPVELFSHVPATTALEIFATFERTLEDAEPREAGPRNLLPPPLPPPRA